MGAAIGGSLLMAVGIALSPVTIIAAVLILTSRQARVNGPVLAVGWLAGLAVVGAFVLSLAEPADGSQSGSPATWVSWLKIIIGVLLLVVAGRQFRRRPRGGEEPSAPKWMASIDSITPVAAFGLAVALVVGNPKNLLLAVAGAAVIAQTGISVGQQAIAYAVFAVIGTLGVGVPVVIYFALGQRSEELLTGLKNWMSQHNAVIMAVLCLVIAVKLFGDAIGALAG